MLCYVMLCYVMLCYVMLYMLCILDDIGHGWADLATIFQQKFPYIKFILPHGLELYI